MVLTSVLLLSGLLFPANCMNLEHVKLKSILQNIGFSSSSQGSLSTATTSATSTTAPKSSLPPVTTGSSYPTTTLSSNDNEQGSVTPLPDMDMTLSENDQREERIVNRPGQKRNQPSNVRRRGDNNRRRGGEQTRRRVETRRKIEVRQDENLREGSRTRTILRPSQVETRVQMAQWDRSDPRSNLSGKHLKLL